MTRSDHASFSVPTADGLFLAAERHGDAAGPEVVLIHGLGQSRVSWARQTGGTLADSCAVVSYDLRGHGDSLKPAREDAYDDPALWADDLHRVVAASGFRRPVLVGWSLGVLVVGQYLRRHGSGGIAGVNAVGAVTSLAPDLQGPAPHAYRAALASPDLATRCDAIAGFLVECFAVPPPEAELRRMLVFNGMVPREVQTGVMAVATGLTDAVWAGVPRMLVSWGDEDRHVKPAMSTHLVETHTAARLSVYEGAAHAPFYERPERFNRELAAFAADACGRAA